LLSITTNSNTTAAAAALTIYISITKTDYRDDDRDAYTSADVAAAVHFLFLL
jgi:hypothetical protein